MSKITHLHIALARAKVNGHCISYCNEICKSGVPKRVKKQKYEQAYAIRDERLAKLDDLESKVVS